MTSPTQTAGSRGAEHRFFSGMAIGILAVALIGFARTYFLRPLLPVPTPVLPSLTPLIHIHGALFTLWVFLFVAQTLLIGRKRIGLHRTLGFASLGLALAMVVVGTITAIHSVARGIAPFGMDPRRFLAIPLAAIYLFAGFYIAGFVKRRNAQSHKRLMLLATIALLPPAIARWVLLLGLGPPFILAFATLLLVPLVVWDWKTRGRLHPVTLWGGGLLLVSAPLRLLLAKSDFWLGIADRLAGLVK
ncbi:MAG: hypothetical protein ABI639_05930 [Thermoanaerobaculia bacterium]